MSLIVQNSLPLHYFLYKPIKNEDREVILAQREKKNVQKHGEERRNFAVQCHTRKFTKDRTEKVDFTVLQNKVPFFAPDLGSVESLLSSLD